MPDNNPTGIRRFKGPDGRERCELEYEIIEGPLPDATPDLPLEVERQYDQLHDLTINEPTKAVPRLEPLVAKYPQLAVLMNWLACSYAATGRQAEADALNERLWREHPDYLFARIARADAHLSKGELDQVPVALGGFDLKLIYPHRNVFHISEAVALWSVICQWLFRRGEFDRAEFYLEQIANIAPDDPAVETLKDMMVPYVLEKAVKSLMERAQRPRRPRKKSATKKRKPRGG